MKGNKRKKKTGLLPWVVTGGIGLALVGGVFLAGRAAGGHHHPQPRPGITAASVLSESQLAGYPGEVASYAVARAQPALLDGLYCYCHCSKHGGHRSLLTCFESWHAASCEVCQREALLAARMHAEGKTVDEIRQAADVAFGT